MSNTTIIYIKNVYLELNIYQKHGLKVKISTMCDNRDYFIKINYHLFVKSVDQAINYNNQQFGLTIIII